MAVGLPVSIENLAESRFTRSFSNRLELGAGARSMQAALVLVGLVVAVIGKSCGAFEIHVVCSSPFVSEGESRDVSHCSAWNPDVASFRPEMARSSRGSDDSADKGRAFTFEPTGRDGDIAHRRLSSWLDTASCSAPTTVKKLAASVPGTAEASPISGRQMGTFLDRIVKSEMDPRKDRLRKTDKGGWLISEPGYVLDRSRRLMVVDGRQHKSAVEGAKKAGPLQKQVGTLKTELEARTAELGAAQDELEKLRAQNATLRAKLGDTPMVSSLGMKTDGTLQGPSKFSLEAMVCWAEAFKIVPGNCFNSFPLAAAAAMRGVLVTLGLDVADDVLAAALPSRRVLPSWIERVASLELAELVSERAGCRGGFILSDAGNFSHQCELFSQWDFTSDKLRLDLAGSGVTGKTGSDVFERLESTVGMMEVKELYGLGSDSAVNMSKTLVAKCRERWPGFKFAPCWLHVLNLILMNAFFAAFGDEARGECSALRVAFMVNYLLDKSFQDFVYWAKNASDFLSQLPPLSSPSRFSATLSTP